MGIDQIVSGPPGEGADGTSIGASLRALNEGVEALPILTLPIPALPMSALNYQGLQILPGVSWVQAKPRDGPPLLGYVVQRDDAIQRVGDDIFLTLQLYPSLVADGPDMFSICPEGYEPQLVLLPLRGCSHICSLWPTHQIGERRYFVVR